MKDYRTFIDSDPKVMLGKPKIVGTRITVELLLRKIADGFSFEDVELMYPGIEKKHILASIRYAAEVLGSEEVIPAA